MGNVMRLRRALLASGVLLLAAVPCLANETVIMSLPAGECTLSLGAADNWPTLRLRAGHPSHQPCRIDKAAVIQVLDQALSEPHPAFTRRVYTSLFIGRLIDYPWLAQFLALKAARDPGWDAAAGKPVGGQINRFVSGILFSPEILRDIDAALHKQGYRITGVSVEKVLVGGFENVPQLEGPRRRGRVPFDAQAWLRLERD
jgi:hypothetical protein